ncbi:hypothetical protein MY4038_002594 [Beauveria bassiana]
MAQVETKNYRFRLHLSIGANSTKSQALVCQDCKTGPQITITLDQPSSTIFGWRLRTQEIKQVNRDLTDKKLRALKQLTPVTGTDGNEADPWVPDWLRGQSGQDNYRFLMSDKRRPR